MWSDTLQWWTVRLGMWQCILVAAGVFVGVEVMCRCWYVSIMCFMLMLKVWAMSILHCCLGSRPCSQALSHYPVDYELGTYGRQDFDSDCWFQDSPNILNPETLLVCLFVNFVFCLGWLQIYSWFYQTKFHPILTPLLPQKQPQSWKDDVGQVPSFSNSYDVLAFFLRGYIR